MELSRTTKELDFYLNNFTQEFEKKLNSKKKRKNFRCWLWLWYNYVGTFKKA